MKHRGRSRNKRKSHHFYIKLRDISPNVENLHLIECLLLFDIKDVDTINIA